MNYIRRWCNYEKIMNKYDWCIHNYRCKKLKKHDIVAACNPKLKPCREAAWGWGLVVKGMTINYYVNLCASKPIK